MNWAIKIILKTLMNKISRISWGGYDKEGVTTKAFTVVYVTIIKWILLITGDNMTN